MDDFLDLLKRGGRWSGLALILLALLLLGIGAVGLWLTGRLFVVLPGLALVLGLLGGMVLLAGGPARRGLGHAVEPPPDLAELVHALSSASRPCWVCVSCRKLVGPGSCLDCGSTADVLQVDTDDDLKMALLAMEG